MVTVSKIKSVSLVLIPSRGLVAVGIQRFKFIIFSHGGDIDCTDVPGERIEGCIQYTDFTYVSTQYASFPNEFNNIILTLFIPQAVQGACHREVANLEMSITTGYRQQLASRKLSLLDRN